MRSFFIRLYRKLFGVTINTQPQPEVKQPSQEVSSMAIKRLDMFNKCKIRPEWNDQINLVVHRINDNEERYDKVSKITGVPYFIIGIIHNLECSGDFRAVLHNGERIIGTGRRTKLVPARRGPFESWEEAAVDALMMKERIFPDWTKIGEILLFLEKYNGMGYEKKGLPSPYLWSGTDQYSKGKYVKDGVFDPNAVSKQIGAAALMKRAQEWGIEIC